MERLSNVKRLYSVGLTAVLFILTLFGISTLFLTQPLSAATTYSYASNGSKIAVNYNGTSYSLNKQPIQTQGKDAYTGSIKISQGGGCMLTIQVLTSGGSSATVEAPAFMNGGSVVTAPGSSTTLPCSKEVAQSNSEFNKSITISGSTNSNTPAPTNPETEGQKQAVVTVYSPVKEAPSASVTMTRVSGGAASTKSLSWNGSVASARWENIAAGTQLRFCVSPTGLFDSQSCKTGTKAQGKTLLIDFGSFENSYNEDGKKVNVDVNFNVAAAPNNTTYGPIPLLLYTEGGENVGSTSTTSNTYGGEDDGPTVAQKSTLAGSFDGVDPGRYKVCLAGNASVCSAVFTKAANMSVKAVINVSDEDSKGLLVQKEGASSCVIEGVGWIVCPVINFLAWIADGAFGFLADTFLRTDPTAFTADSPTYKAWTIMRTVANVLFVIAFLFIIFSQLTSMGISNYGVKKMLPRLVVAAILVNVSFIISQLAVDLSNILGYSIRDVFDIVSEQVRGETYNDVASAVATGGTFSNIAVGVLAFGGAAIALYALLSAFGAIVLAAALALLMILFILIARQAIVILLVVLSPIAFVAMLLPNTERLFKFWRKTLTAMLLLFPIIALVFGASTLASTILQGSFTAAYNGEGSNWFGQIVASAVLVLPLFVVPILLKKSLDGIPMLGQMANKWSGRANSRLSSKAKEGYRNSAWGRGRAVRKQARQTYRDRKFAGSVVKGGVAGKIAGLAAGGLGKSDAQKYAQQAIQRSAVAVNEKARGEDISTAAALLYEKHDDPTHQIPDIAKELEEAIVKGDVIKARAAQSILLTSGGKGLDTLAEVHAKSLATSAARNSDVGKSLRNALNSAGLKGKHNGLASLAYTDASLAEINATPGTFNLSPAELGNQRLGLLQEALKANPSVISAQQATDVLSSPEVTKDMDVEKKAIFQDISSGKTPYSAGSAAAAAKAAKDAAKETAKSAAQARQAGQQPSTEQVQNPVAQESQTGQQAGAGPGAPGTTTQPSEAQSAGPAAQRAQQTIAQAAQGTTGTSPFVVGSEGTATVPADHTVPTSGSLVIPHGKRTAAAPTSTSTPPVSPIPPSTPPIPDHPEDYHQRTP